MDTPLSISDINSSYGMKQWTIMQAGALVHLARIAVTWNQAKAPTEDRPP
jgi:hypothetical protein